LLSGDVEQENYIHLFDFGVAPEYQLVYRKQPTVSNLRMVETTELSLKVAWDTAHYLTFFYILVKRTVLGDQYYNIAKQFLPGEISSYTIEGLAAGTSYTVKVVSGQNGHYEENGAVVSGTTAGASLCGNGVLDTGEECDDGDLNGADTSDCNSECVHVVTVSTTSSSTIVTSANTNATGITTTVVGSTSTTNPPLSTSSTTILPASTMTGTSTITNATGRTTTIVGSTSTTKSQPSNTASSTLPATSTTTGSSTTTTCSTTTSSQSSGLGCILIGNETWSNCDSHPKLHCCTKNGGLRCMPTPQSCGPGLSEGSLCGPDGCNSSEKCCKDSNTNGSFYCVDKNVNCPETNSKKKRTKGRKKGPRKKKQRVRIIAHTSPSDQDFDLTKSEESPQLPDTNSPQRVRLRAHTSPSDQDFDLTKSEESPQLPDTNSPQRVRLRAHTSPSDQDFDLTKSEESPQLPDTNSPQRVRLRAHTSSSDQDFDLTE